MNPDGHSASSIRPHLFDEVGGSQLSGVVSLPPVAVPSGNPRTDAVAALDLPLSMRGLGDPRLGTVRDDLLSLPWNPDQQIVPRSDPQPGVTHLLTSTEARQTATMDAAATFNNWAGVTIKGNWQFVYGKWKVPAVSEPGVPETVGAGEIGRAHV